ncbi:S1C family serine protease [Chloroflexota bacterium]
MKAAKIKYLTISFILILSLLVGAGCTLVAQEESEPPVSSELENSTPATPVVTTTTPVNTAIDPDWIPPICKNNEPLPDFVAVVAKVKPSVVAIEIETGGGTGWIIDTNGIIVTNNHVVAGAENIRVIMDDGSTYDVIEVRTDPLTDLAVIEIDARGLPAADIGDCRYLQVGAPVAAIGNALGLGIRMTGGWISRLNASIQIQGQIVDDLIETDAAINPGNSGGPLVNMAGEVIGITSLKIAQVGVEGLGYAINMNTAQDIIDQLIVRGYVIRPYLGVGLAEVTPLAAFLADLSVDSGALIINVEQSSPADAAGLEEDDVIVKLDGRDVATIQDLLEAIHSRDIGQEVTIVYWRGNDRFTTTATLTASPPPPWL